MQITMSLIKQEILLNHRLYYLYLLIYYILGMFYIQLSLMFYLYYYLLKNQLIQDLNMDTHAKIVNYFLEYYNNHN